VAQVARHIGVSRQMLEAAIKRRGGAAAGAGRLIGAASPDTGAAPSPSPAGSLGQPLDAFEAAQILVFESAVARLQAGELTPDQLAKLGKTINDTAKAVRLHRAQSRIAVATSDEVTASAERVRERLERMLAGPRLAEPAADESEHSEEVPRGAVAR
jgi:hypothetical protein